MKYVVEFGLRGGACCENAVVPTEKLANQLARSLVAVFTDQVATFGSRERDWYMPKSCYRVSWHSLTHFIAISRLDGISRGPAASKLWKKDPEEKLEKPVMRSEWYG